MLKKIKKIVNFILYEFLKALQLSYYKNYKSLKKIINSKTNQDSLLVLANSH